MLLPRKVKHRKHQKNPTKGKAYVGNQVAFGAFGLKALSPAWVSARQIEAARRAMTRFVQRGGKIWIRIFPDKPITQKGAELPMGKGKGTVDHFVAVVKPGRVIFEIDGVNLATAREALNLAAHKLSLKTKIVQREGLKMEQYEN